MILSLDLPSRLYPTVGLQTPGEIIDANFGQEPFKFDIEGEMRELRRKTQSQVEELSWPRKQGEEQAVLHHMVLSYLVHHGYSQTAEGFARCVGQEISEELVSMRNRQHIQKLVLAGKIGEAITSVDQLYPTLLSLNQDLHFRLKVSWPALVTVSQSPLQPAFSAGATVHRDGERGGQSGGRPRHQHQLGQQQLHHGDRGD